MRVAIKEACNQMLSPAQCKRERKKRASYRPAMSTKSRAPGWTLAEMLDGKLGAHPTVGMRAIARSHNARLMRGA
jgi:hypothetical protein